MVNSFDQPNNVLYENQRLAAIKKYNFIYSSKDEYVEDLLCSAADIFSVPIAIVNIVEKDDVKVRASFGYPDVKTFDKMHCLCSIAIANKNVSVFEDASKDPCLLANPYVHGSFGLRFYAGAPLITNDNFVIGAVAIIDFEARNFSMTQQNILKRIANEIVKHFNSKITNY